MTKTCNFIALLILLFFPSRTSFGQDTTYFIDNWTETNSIDQANYYTVVLHDIVDTNSATEYSYFVSGQIKTKREFCSFKDKIEDGKIREWYESGQLKRDIDYKDGNMHGKLLTYWDNGNPKRIDNYIANKLIDRSEEHTSEL